MRTALNPPSFSLRIPTIRRVGVLRRSDNSVVVMDAAAPQFTVFH